MSERQFLVAPVDELAKRLVATIQEGVKQDLRNLEAEGEDTTYVVFNPSEYVHSVTPEQGIIALALAIEEHNKIAPEGEQFSVMTVEIATRQ